MPSSLPQPLSSEDSLLASVLSVPVSCFNIALPWVAWRRSPGPPFLWRITSTASSASAAAVGKGRGRGRDQALS